MADIPVSTTNTKGFTTATQGVTNTNATASVSVNTPSNLSNLLSGNLTIDAVTPFKDWFNKDTTKKVLYDLAFFAVGIILFFVGLQVLGNEMGIPEKATKLAALAL